MEAETEITQTDADSLSEKLETFVATLTPGEQDALKMALAQSGVAEGDDTGGFLRRVLIATPWGHAQVDATSFAATPWGRSPSIRAR
jgi:hypothetical protein